MGEAAAHYRENEPRGEFVLVVEGAQAPAAPDQEYTLEDAVEMARSLAAGGLSASEAAKEAAKETGFKKGGDLPPHGPGREPGVRKAFVKL